MSEEWRPVRGFEGIYEVNRKGDVRRLQSKGSRHARPVADGYNFLVLCGADKRVRVTKKELVVETFGDE